MSLSPANPLLPIPVRRFPMTGTMVEMGSVRGSIRHTGIGRRGCGSTPATDQGSGNRCWLTGAVRGDRPMLWGHCGTRQRRASVGVRTTMAEPIVGSPEGEPDRRRLRSEPFSVFAGAPLAAQFDCRSPCSIDEHAERSPKQHRYGVPVITGGSEWGGSSDDSCRAVDDRQRRQAVGRGGHEAPGSRAGRLLCLVGGQVRQGHR